MIHKTADAVEQFIVGLDIRIKRLESNIGTATDAVLKFLSVKEKIGCTDTVYIYKRDVNDSFLLGTSRVGDNEIGDRRSAEELLWSGG